MDRSQWIVSRDARASGQNRNGGARANVAEDWLLSNGAAARSSHPAAPPTGMASSLREPAAPPRTGNVNDGLPASDPEEDAELAAFYERTSRLQSCVEEMDRRAMQVSRRISRLASILPTGAGFSPAPAPEAFVPPKLAQRSSRSKATAEPIRSIVEGWVPKRK